MQEDRRWKPSSVFGRDRKLRCEQGLLEEWPGGTARRAILTLGNGLEKGFCPFLSI